MQTYYELGYANALEKLGMTDKTAIFKFLRRAATAAKEAPKAYHGGPTAWGNAPSTVLKGEGLAAGQGLPVKAKPPKSPVVESGVKPDVKTPEIKEPKGPGFLRRHWLPIAAGTGLAGAGGYAYLKNRDPMGQGGQLPSGYGGGGGY